MSVASSKWEYLMNTDAHKKDYIISGATAEFCIHVCDSDYPAERGAENGYVNGASQSVTATALTLQADQQWQVLLQDRLAA